MCVFLRLPDGELRPVVVAADADVAGTLRAAGLPGLLMGLQVKVTYGAPG
eukprot:gene7037-2096_t